jgi:hypothetical protein
MPATAMTSCSTPADDSSTCGDCSSARPLAISPLDCDWPSAACEPSQLAVRLLKYSEDDSRLTGGCLERAMTSGVELATDAAAKQKGKAKEQKEEEI